MWNIHPNEYKQALVLILCFLSLPQCADFDSCIFILNWLTSTPETYFVQFYLKVASYFLSWGKNKNMTLGMRLLWKYIRKSKLVYQK